MACATTVRSRQGGRHELTKVRFSILATARCCRGRHGGLITIRISYVRGSSSHEARGRHVRRQCVSQQANRAAFSAGFAASIARATQTLVLPPRLDPIVTHNENRS